MWHSGYATGVTQRPGTEQLSVSSTAAVTLTTHMQFWVSTSPTWPTSKLYTQRPATVRCCSPAGSRYVGPPTAMSNTSRNIQTDAALSSLPGPPTQTMLTLGWGEEYAHRGNASHSPVIERILATAGAYYTRELVFSPSTAMKSRTVYYMRVRIVSEILRYIAPMITGEVLFLVLYVCWELQLFSQNCQNRSATVLGLCQ